MAGENAEAEKHWIGWKQINLLVGVGKQVTRVGEVVQLLVW